MNDYIFFLEDFPTSDSSSSLQYMDTMDDLFSDTAWVQQNLNLMSALVQYLVAVSHFPLHMKLPIDCHHSFTRFVVLCVEVRSINLLIIFVKMLIDDYNFLKFNEHY